MDAFRYLCIMTHEMLGFNRYLNVNNRENIHIYINSHLFPMGVGRNYRTPPATIFTYSSLSQEKQSKNKEKERTQGERLLLSAGMIQGCRIIITVRLTFLKRNQNKRCQRFEAINQQNYRIKHILFYFEIFCSRVKGIAKKSGRSGGISSDEDWSRTLLSKEK